MPPGTCIIDPAANVTISSGLWLRGAGRNGTTLKRKNSSAGGSILTLAADGITLSDFAIDGNKGGPGVATSADSIAASAPSNFVTIQRMNFANATGSDIVSPTTGAGLYVANWRITENEFQNQGLPACSKANSCANMLIRQPLNLHVTHNRSDSSQHFAIFSSAVGGGFVEVGDNTITNLNGFAVALGQGVPGSDGVDIHHNLITNITTDPDNLIDLSNWTDFTVNHNVIYHNGQFTVGGATTSCISAVDAPHGVIDANSCYGVPTNAVSVTGIVAGQSETTISNNFVQGCSGAGIAFSVSSQGPRRGVKIWGNTTKNNNTQGSSVHAGIELYISPGAVSSATISDVLIRNNHSYDDQPTPTQSYGIGIGLGVTVPIMSFSNIIVEGNDVAGNIKSGILNSATIPNFSVRNNFGFNPVGVIQTPPFPAPTAGAFTNDTGYDVMVYITAGTMPISIAINGVTLNGVTIGAGGAGSPIRLAANQNITLSYTAGGAPSWQWVGD
ncbi:MAG TPA: right-handed parallel beta-helix repeat-containing protein [Candidatus Sulfotelmatobacter sp.]|nr:right-handed parallel beta-helix repeat-containing protein [Candidatus Sulfotelmatobacter sp.]